MKRILISTLLIFLAISMNAQSKNEIICRLGFTFEISKSSNWGTQKPVITGINPYTSAEQAGLKPADIIESIDGISTKGLKAEEINQLLHRSGKNEVMLGIKNLANPLRQLLVKKECKKANAISEGQLASAFAMYSLENTNERLFTCPFKITTSENIDFSLFKTYAFAALDENNKKLESIINGCIGKELAQKGLQPSSENPDLLVQTFYFFDKNPKYKGMNKVQINIPPTYRYNIINRKMEKYPFLSSSAVEAEAEYLLQLGFRLVDRRGPDKAKLPILWECEAYELLSESFRLEEYARIFIPLMCMEYPYVKYTRNVPYKASLKIYNYTGINYDSDKMNQVADVDRNAPAYAAGIRPRDIIEKIDNNNMDYTTDEFSKGYKQFISSTMQYRDPATLFTDAAGFKQCMFWDPLQYSKIADILSYKECCSAFSYLYFFAPYINPSGSNACNFVVKRGSNQLEIIIRPTIRSEVTVQVN